MQADLQAIILAAGKSTRFNTGNTKMLEKICGQELILYPTTILERMNIPTTLVVGYQKELIKNTIEKKHNNRIHFVEQEKQQGTGNALLCTKELWEKNDILIMNGDMPLVTQDILQALIKKHYNTNATISFVTAHNGDPSGSSYGRIIKTDSLIKIIEARELSQSEIQEHCCINAGIYLVKKQFLEKNSNELKRNELSNEFQITDLVKMASEKGQKKGWGVWGADRVYVCVYVYGWRVNKKLSHFSKPKRNKGHVGWLMWWCVCGFPCHQRSGFRSGS